MLLSSLQSNGMLPGYTAQGASTVARVCFCPVFLFVCLLNKPPPLSSGQHRTGLDAWEDKSAPKNASRVHISREQFPRPVRHVQSDPDRFGSVLIFCNVNNNRQNLTFSRETGLGSSRARTRPFLHSARALTVPSERVPVGPPEST